ncbi:MAG TPA: ADYC domain-containing protein [Kofleriaceae bacterium]|nr:ADYC domain-containing protein [Kofleriaceae bacterium]
MRHRLYMVLALASCATDIDFEEGQTSQDVDSNNGTSLNGTSLNGTSLNGTSLNGTSISATSSSGPPLSGTGPVGSKWSGTATNGTSVNLRIDSASQGTGTNADLWFYGVSFQTSTGWQPLCGLDANNVPIQAVPVAGAWKATAADQAAYVTTSSQFTWGCRLKTVAKCVELGYKTWKGYSNQLQACVRLLRADYCGTGVSYTVDGTLLNLYDSVGVQKDTETWPAEAEWTPTGATCVNKNNLARYTLAVEKDPKCVKPLKTTTCGTTFTNGAILIDELAPH